MVGEQFHHGRFGKDPQHGIGVAEFDGVGLLEGHDPLLQGTDHLQAGAVIVLGALPGFELDDHLDFDAVFDGARAEQAGHVDDADAAQFDEVADVGRGHAHDLVRGDLA